MASGQVYDVHQVQIIQALQKASLDTLLDLRSKGYLGDNQSVITLVLDEQSDDFSTASNYSRVWVRSQSTISDK